MRLAILTSHPIQYYAPLFRELARRLDLVVHFAHKATPQQQADAGYGTSFEWDVDLFSGYEYTFLRNISRQPNTAEFSGCDTPEIGEHLDRGKFDALLVTGWNLKSYWQGIWAAKQRGIHVVARGDSHLDTPRGLAKCLMKRATYPMLLRSFDAAAYVGMRNFDYWRHYDYPAERLFFSPHCVDTEHFSSRATEEARSMLRRKLGIDARAPVALFAGRLVPLKRTKDLLEAAKLVRAMGIDLQVLIAGSGELEGCLRAQAQAECVPVHFVGFQNQSEMPGVYAASDALVLPSARETWGLVANEALACGGPIIVSDACGCAPDLTTEDGAGRAFPVGNVKALAEALRTTLSEPPPRDAIARLSNRFSVVSAASGIEEAAAAARRRSRIAR